MKLRFRYFLTVHNFQNTQEIKRMLFNWMKQDKTCKFSRKSSFSSYVQHKKQKNRQLIQLILCQLDVGGWRKESCALFLCQPPTSYWHKVSWINCLWFCFFMLYIAWKRGLSWKFAHFVLFDPIKKHSFNLLCVWDLFPERWQSTLFQILLFVILHSQEKTCAV